MPLRYSAATNPLQRSMTPLQGWRRMRWEPQAPCQVIRDMLWQQAQRAPQWASKGKVCTVSEWVLRAPALQQLLQEAAQLRHADARALRRLQPPDWAANTTHAHQPHISPLSSRVPGNPFERRTVVLLTASCGRQPQDVQGCHKRHCACHAHEVCSPSACHRQDRRGRARLSSRCSSSCTSARSRSETASRKCSLLRNTASFALPTRPLGTDLRTQPELALSDRAPRLPVFHACPLLTCMFACLPSPHPSAAVLLRPGVTVAGIRLFHSHDCMDHARSAEEQRPPQYMSAGAVRGCDGQRRT